MINITWKRFWISFIAGFLLTSQLNYGAAIFVLNPIVTPMFDGFMKVGDASASVENIMRMTFGFMAPVFVSTYFLAALSKPVAWLPRTLLVGSMVSFSSFFGVYTFIAGWGNVKLDPLMIVALCDWITLTTGLLLTGFIQDYKRSEA